MLDTHGHNTLPLKQDDEEANECLRTFHENKSFKIFENSTHVINTCF